MTNDNKDIFETNKGDFFVQPPKRANSKQAVNNPYKDADGDTVKYTRADLAPQPVDVESLKVPSDPVVAMRLGFSAMQWRNRKHYNQAIDNLNQRGLIRSTPPTGGDDEI